MRNPPLPQAHKAEDEKYAEIKAQLRQEIRQLREKVLSMMAANEGLPDIERLESHDFVLDTEEYQRLQAQQDSLIQQVVLCTCTLSDSPYMYSCY